MRSTSPLRALPARQRTLPALLDLQSERHGDRLLVRTPATAITVAEMRDRAARTAGALVEAGVAPGDAVATLGENRVELLELWLGCAWLGAVYAPVNTALRGPQLTHVLRDIGARVLFAEDELLPAVEQVRDELPSLDRVVTFTELTPGAPTEAARPRPADVSTILYTSGTTGPSKGVECPHAQWYWWGVVTGELLGVTADDVLYTCLPLFHTNAMNAFVQALLAGAVFTPGPRFSASRLWERLIDSEATVTYLLGAMVHILSKREPHAQDRGHRVRIALAPATPASLAAPFRERFGIELVDAWGSTESNCVIATDDASAPAGSMGRVLPDFEARVVDDDDETVPDGTPGELVVRSRLPHAFATGYRGLPAATVAARRDLWLHTGDRVIRDDDGWFWFVDRLSDSIRRRGENISSYEVEAVVSGHPDVMAAAVVPVPSDLGEDEVLALVVPRPGAAVDPVSLVRFCEPRLAYFAIPRYIEVIEELPLTPGGKIEKYKLRERGLTAGAWDREAAGVELVRRPG